jgi:hypothetical protein
MEKTTTVTIAAHIPEALHAGFECHILLFKLAHPQCAFSTDEKGRLVVTLPDECCGPYLQHIRDFDTANPDCRFEIVMNAPHMSDEAVSALYDAIEPPFKYRKTFRKH